MNCKERGQEIEKKQTIRHKHDYTDLAYTMSYIEKGNRVNKLVYKCTGRLGDNQKCRQMFKSQMTKLPL